MATKVGVDIGAAPVCFVPPLPVLGRDLTRSPSAAALGYVVSPLAGLKGPFRCGLRFSLRDAGRETQAQKDAGLARRYVQTLNRDGDGSI